MPRTASASPTAVRGRRRAAAPFGGGDASDLLGRVEALVHELQALREENAALREETDAATQFFARVEAALSGRGGHGARRGGGDAIMAAQRARATASAVDGAMVREVIEALGQASAAEIAAEIGRRGHEVSGRAVRFIAEHAGASIVVNERGQRRYSL